jgi:hypothetical protein
MSEFRFQNSAKRAEAKAMERLDVIHRQPWGLTPLTLADNATEAAFVTELLYSPTYSLLFEAGHRWVDFRRYGRLAQLPKINTQIQREDVPVRDVSGRRVQPAEPGASAWVL